MTGQVLPDDDHGQTGGSQVLLGPGEDDAKLGHVHGHGQNVRGHVAHQGHVAGVGDIAPLGAIDGVVGAVIEVAGVLVQRQLVLGGNIAVILVLRGGGQVDLAVLFGLLISQIGEVAGDGVIRLTGLSDQVQRNHGELAGGTRLQKQDLIALRHIHQSAQLSLGLLKDLDKGLRAVTHLHH